MTVLGPLPGKVDGAILPHEHVVANLYRITRDPNHLLIDVDLAIEELKHLKVAGGKLLVDVTNRGLGRDPLTLRRVAAETGIHIVMGSGWYREPYYDQAIHRQTVNDLAAEIESDVRDGADNTGVKSGVIGEIGADQEFISPSEERVLRASARAQKATGLSLVTHAARSAVGLAQLDLLEDEGVDLRRVIIGHCDTYPDPDYHAALARRGAYVSFDTVRGESAWEIRRRVEWITAMRASGYLRQVLLSQDVCMKSHLHAYGGNGYDYVLTGFADHLRANEFDDEDIHVLTWENPYAALTGLQRGSA